MYLISKNGKVLWYNLIFFLFYFVMCCCFFCMSSLKKIHLKRYAMFFLSLNTLSLFSFDWFWLANGTRYQVVLVFFNSLHTKKKQEKNRFRFVYLLRFVLERLVAGYFCITISLRRLSLPPISTSEIIKRKDFNY